MEERDQHRIGLAALFLLTGVAAVVFAEIRVVGFQTVALAWAVMLAIMLLVPWLD